MNRLHKSQKGQVWTIDFIIGVILFVFVVLISVNILLDMHISPHSEALSREAIHISDTLLLAGYPENWNATEVIVPGISGNNRINESKLIEFDALDYYEVKTLLHTKNDFIFFIKNSTSIQNISQCTHGYVVPNDENCTPVLSELDYANLVKIERLVIYDSKVMIMTVYVWD